jgi:protein-L-isoaspartate(D-aspartate) O-methyltransferase
MSVRLQRTLLAICLLIMVGALAQQTIAREGYRVEREQMVRRDLQSGIFGRQRITDENVLRAMETVPRHRFVPMALQDDAYADTPLPIGYDQTISQPYIVALMTQAISPDEDDIVLEVGTGSGYQAAVLAEIVAQVYTIEIVEPLGLRAREDLADAGYDNVEVRIGDGYQGWPEHAPFDAIIVTAAPEHVPQPLIDQLKTGGRMVIPVGERYGAQELRLLTKRDDGTLDEETIEAVRFVPMTGEAEKNGQ